MFAPPFFCCFFSSFVVFFSTWCLIFFLWLLRYRFFYWGWDFFLLLVPLYVGFSLFFSVLSLVLLYVSFNPQFIHDFEFGWWVFVLFWCSRRFPNAKELLSMSFWNKPHKSTKKTLLYAILLLKTFVLQGNPHTRAIGNSPFNRLLQAQPLLTLLLVGFECFRISHPRC